jgi:hypothetical protein
LARAGLLGSGLDVSPAPGSDDQKRRNLSLAAHQALGRANFPPTASAQGGLDQSPCTQIMMLHHEPLRVGLLFCSYLLREQVW